jgi:hypothetical protein
MSVNLEASVQKEDGSDTVLLLTGFTRGITHSAQIGVGDVVNLPLTNGRKLAIDIQEIHHDWQQPGSEVAPNSTACGNARVPVKQEDFVYLLNLGCREI